MSKSREALFLGLAAIILLLIAWHRAPEYDEAYSLFLTAGHARPSWPHGIFTAGAARELYAGHAGFGQISTALRMGDVHPPLYFWALELWRRLTGPSWLAARGLSVLFTLGTLLALARLARRANVPVGPALALTLLSYGFAYTGIVARDFALAQLLDMLGVLALFGAAQQNSRNHALAGGLAFGAASFTNYLAVFTAGAALLWLLWRRQWRAACIAMGGMALFLPVDLFFFLAQRDSRAGQFAAFSLPHALARLARDGGAAWFGGLPLYAGWAEVPVILALAGLFLAGLWHVARRRHEQAGLFALLALATPLGLLLLGVVFNNSPIEIRYLGFAMPWVALLLAPALPRWLLALFLTVQAGAIAGLGLAPATMQPQARAAHLAARYAGALVLLPFGNDGVGVPGPFIAAAPDDMRILLIHPGAKLPDNPDTVRVALRVDEASRAVAARMHCAGLVCGPALGLTPGGGADEQQKHRE